MKIPVSKIAQSFDVIIFGMQSKSVNPICGCPLWSARKFFEQPISQSNWNMVVSTSKLKRAQWTSQAFPISGQQRFSCLLWKLWAHFFLPILIFVSCHLRNCSDKCQTMATTQWRWRQRQRHPSAKRNCRLAHTAAEHVLHSSQNLFMERILRHLCWQSDFY